MDIKLKAAEALKPISQAYGDGSAESNEVLFTIAMVCLRSICKSYTQKDIMNTVKIIYQGLEKNGA